MCFRVGGEIPNNVYLGVIDDMVKIFWIFSVNPPPHSKRGNFNSPPLSAMSWGVGFSDRGPKPVVPNRNP